MLANATKPKIVCLCGSTRFHEQFLKYQNDLTIAGEIVLTIGYPVKSDGELFHDMGLTEDEQKKLKWRLDVLHLHKIDLCDYVLVLNVGNYIGDSTGREIEYALSRGKPVKYLEDPCPASHVG